MKDLGCALKGARAKSLVDLVILTKSFESFGLIWRFTLPETNIAPKNDGFQ